jgi:hypothetical protein
MLTKVRPIKFKDVTDGLSKTFMVGEVGGPPLTAGDEAKICGLWKGSIDGSGTAREVCRHTTQKPNDGSNKSFGSMHAGGIVGFIMGDASVTFISDTIGSNSLGMSDSAASPLNISTELARAGHPSARWSYHATVNLFRRCLKVIDTFRDGKARCEHDQFGDRRFVTDDSRLCLRAASYA